MLGGVTTPHRLLHPFRNAAFFLFVLLQTIFSPLLKASLSQKPCPMQPPFTLLVLSQGTLFPPPHIANRGKDIPAVCIAWLDFIVFFFF